MKILNLSIEIKIDKAKNIESNYLSRRSDFIVRLSNLPELSNIN